MSSWSQNKEDITLFQNGEGSSWFLESTKYSRLQKIIEIVADGQMVAVDQLAF